MKSVSSTLLVVLLLSLATPKPAKAGIIEGALIGAAIGGLVGLIISLFQDEPEKPVEDSTLEQDQLDSIPVSN